MRIKTNTKLKFKKVFVKEDKKTNYKNRNESKIVWLKTGEPFVFYGSFGDKKFNWETKENVTGFSVNERGLKVDTEKETYFFDIIK